MLRKGRMRALAAISANARMVLYLAGTASGTSSAPEWSALRS